MRDLVETRAIVSLGSSDRCSRGVCLSLAVKASSPVGWILHTRTIIYGVVCAGVFTPAIGGVRTIAYLYYNIREPIICVSVRVVKVRDKLRRMRVKENKIK